MKRTSNLWRTILAIAFLLMTVSLTAFGSNRYNVEVEKQTDEFYVNDFANLFTEKDKQVMMENAVKLAEEYDGIQVVVSTVNSLNGNQIEEYAYSMYEQYGIGKDSMGILILLSVEDRQVKIETGKTMQAYITDSKSGQLLDNYGMQYFKEDRFAEGLKSVQEAVIAEIRNVVPIDWSSTNETSNVTEVPDAVAPTTGDEVNNGQQNKWQYMLFGYLFVLVFVIPIVLNIIQLVRYWKKYNEFKTQVNELEEDNGKLSEENSKLKERNNNGAKKIQELEKSCLSLKECVEAFREDNSKLEMANKTLAERLASTNEFYSRVLRLHPELDFEKEVKKMLEAEAMAEARVIDQKLNSVLGMPADKDNVEVFEDAIKAYDNAETKAQQYNISTFSKSTFNPKDAKIKAQQYVKADIAKVRALYQESVKLREAYEKEQQELRDKAEAQKAYNEMIKVYHNNQKGTYEEYDALHKAYSLYEELTYAQKEFFTDDKMLREYEIVLRKAQEDKRNYDAARNAEEAAKQTIGHIHSSADEDDRDKISKAFRYYNNLSMAQRAYFSAELLNQMRKFKNEADDDHARRERRREEERQREHIIYSSHHNSSSGFSGGSHFGGFGGHSSGGGASRGF